MEKRTKQQIEKDLTSKRETYEILSKYFNKKGDRLPNGQSATDYMIMYSREIRNLEKELDEVECLSEERIRAIARGETYYTEEEKAANNGMRKFMRSIVSGIHDVENEDELRKRFRKMIKAGK